MSLLKIEKEVATPGEAQNFLRGIVALLNTGVQKGKEWVLGEGEIEKGAPEPRARILHPILKEYAEQLQDRLASEELMEVKLDPADLELLQGLSKALYEEGYGKEIEIGPDSSQDKAGTTQGQGDAPKEGEGGNDATASAGGSKEQEEALERGRRFPWDK